MMRYFFYINIYIYLYVWCIEWHYVTFIGAATRIQVPPWLCNNEVFVKLTRYMLDQLLYIMCIHMFINTHPVALFNNCNIWLRFTCRIRRALGMFCHQKLFLPLFIIGYVLSSKAVLLAMISQPPLDFQIYYNFTYSWTLPWR